MRIAATIIRPEDADKVAPVVEAPAWMKSYETTKYVIAEQESTGTEKDGKESQAIPPLDSTPMIQQTRLWPRVGVFDRKTGGVCKRTGYLELDGPPSWERFIRKADLLLPPELVKRLLAPSTAPEKEFAFYLFGEVFHVVFNEFGKNWEDDTQKRLLAQGKFRYIVMITTRQLVVAGMFWNSNEAFWDYLLSDEPQETKAGSSDPMPEGKPTFVLKVSKSALWLMDIVQQLLFWGY